MKRIRRVLIHCAYIAVLIDVGACSSEDGLAASAEVQAAGEGHDLRFSKKHHEKKKKKHHWDDCNEGEDAGTSEDAGAPTCLSIALHVDSIKQREDTQKVERTINVRIPKTLDALYWGKRLEAELSLQQGDKRVICTYAARRHKFGGVQSPLELQSCDNGAKAGDSIAIDSATLSLECSKLIPFAKVSVELPEIEPCGEPPTTPECDPTKVDDADPCTADTCDPRTGSVSHTPVTTDDNNACTTDACNPLTGVTHTPVNSDDNNACTTDACNPLTGVTYTQVIIDDNNACTVDACNALTGISHTPVSTDDDDICTRDECDPATGVITHTPVCS